MLRKMTVNSDPLSVENAYAQYVANVARMMGRRALLQAAKNEKFLIPLDRGGIKDVVKGMSHRPYEGRTAAGFELIEFEGKEWAVPKGVAKMLRDTINPKPLVSGDAARAMLDTFDASTRMFRKMALAYSPTWIMNNVLGNTALYALGGGSPKELARMLGLKVGSDLEKWMLEHGKTPGKLVSKLAEEYRELIPNTVVRGLIDVDVNMRNLHNTVGPEYYTRAEETWWQQGKMRLNAMARDTVGRVPGARKAADVVGAGLMPYQNFIEEWFRGAMWLTKAQRTARSELMLGVADKTVLLNSADWRMRVKALADEFTGIQTSNTPGGGFKPSPISEAARETLGEVNKWLNDYYRLSPFERNVLRRAVPFYSWMKFTNRLAVQLPYNHPIRMSVAAHTSNVMNDALSLGEVLPDWLKDAISAGENPDGTTTFRSQSGSKETSEGQVTFRGGKGVNVFQGILLGNEGLQTAWQGLNPVLLVPFEWTFGYDTFRQQPFRVADTRAAKQNIARDYQSGESFKVGPDGKMEPYTPRPTIPLAIARSGFVPHFGQMERVIRGGAHDDVGSISELAFEIGRLTAGEPRTYPGVFMDSDSGEPLAPATPGDAAMSVLGMGTKKVNVGEAVEREKKKRVLALQRLKTAKKRERSEIENWLEDLQVDSDAF